MQAKKKSTPVLARSSLGPGSTPARRNWITPFLFLFVAPLIVLWPVVFGGYTLSQNANAIDTRVGYGGFYDRLTIMDPGGNLLDEPSLVLVARNLAKGRIPLLNMHNGMGAPHVESLLTGTLYVLNPLLLLLPITKPVYFDIFIILHVYILLFGAYFLLRQYASPTASVVVSMLLTFSGVTFLHWNAIHYRSLVWAPWMMAGIVGVVRGQHVRRQWLLLVGATAACGTAGNVQEFTLDLFATCVVGACEWAVLHGTSRRRAFLLAASGLAFGFAISSIAFLPFFIAQSQGWTFIPAGAFRSTQSYDPAFLLSWLIPRITGPYTNRFLQEAPYHPHPDYSLMGFFLLVLGAISGWTAWRSGARNRAWMCLGPGAVIVLGLVKIVHFPFLDFVGSIPLLKDLWFVKYHSYLFVLAAIPSAIGLDRVLTADLRESRVLTGRALAITCAVLAVAMLYLWLKQDYSAQWTSPEPIVRETFRKWILTVAIFAAVIPVVFFRPRVVGVLLIVLATAQCMVNLPQGNAKRKPFYGTHLDYPSSTLPGQRLLVSDFANSNILFDRESLAVTDSVTNRYYREFMDRFFHVANAGTMLQPILKDPITDRQALSLRVAGVEQIVGYVAQTPFIRAASVLDPFPRAFLVTPATFKALRGVKIEPNNVADVVKLLDADRSALPQPANARVFDETVLFDLPARSAGAVLVLNQAYSPNWKLNGRTPALMAELWPAWDLGAGNAAKATAVYWPEGLGPAMAVSATSAAAALAFYLMVVRKEKEA